LGFDAEDAELANPRYPGNSGIAALKSKPHPEQADASPLFR
jgi:hypothetical protein